MFLLPHTSLLAHLAIFLSIIPNTMASNKTKTTLIKPFTLSSPAGTDIWRKPPTTNVFTAPTHPSPLPQHPLSTFHRARLTFTLPAAPTLRQYDQAGLLLHLTHPDVPSEADKWLKTGIEWYYGKPYVSTVGCDVWADWSIVPVPSSSSSNNTSSSSTSNSSATGPTATIEVRREGDKLGTSLWVYLIVPKEGGEERVPLREVNWVFAQEEGWSVGVGGYVARPTVEGGEGELDVEFGEGVEVEVYE